MPQLHNPMLLCHTNIKSYSILLSSRTRLLTPDHSNPYRSNPNRRHRNEPKLRRESNPKLLQCFPLHAAPYPLSYQKAVAILHKMALKNPRCHLRQNSLKSYFAVNGKINTTIFLFFQNITKFKYSNLFMRCRLPNTSGTNILILFYYLDELDCCKHVTSEATTRIEPKTSAALLSPRCAPTYCASKQL